MQFQHVPGCCRAQDSVSTTELCLALSMFVKIGAEDFYVRGRYAWSYVETFQGVKKGDRVLFTSYAGTEVTVDSKEYLIMTEDDILAIVD